MSKPLRIAICGAGVGGLALTLTLGTHNKDLQIDLYEAGPQISTVGAGISVWARTLEVLQLLGLEDRMRERGILEQAKAHRIVPKFRRSDQSSPGEYFLTDALPSDYGGLTMHRPDLIDLLKDSLPANCSVHLLKRMKTYTTTSESKSTEITMHFTDGTIATADVLVGADGVHSATRASMFGALAERNPEGIPDGVDHETLLRCKDPVWSGTVAYRCMFPAERLREIDTEHLVLQDQMIALGKDRHIVAYAIARRTIINFVGFDTIAGGEGAPFPSDKWVSNDVSVEQVRKLYEGWEPAVQSMLECIDSPSRWAIHICPPLPFYAHGNVALIGDAAHAMETHFGAGAGQAIESAYILGRLLSHPSTRTSNDIERALQIYTAIRQPFANRVVEKSRLVGQMYEFAAPGLYDGVRNRVDVDAEDVEAKGLSEIAEAVKREWEWVSRHGLLDDWRRAENVLLGGK